MSVSQPDDLTGLHRPEDEVFRALAVSNQRLTVLATLFDQAGEHFGHRPLQVSNVHLSSQLGADSEPVFLASAEFTIGH